MQSRVLHRRERDDAGLEKLAEVVYLGPVSCVGGGVVGFRVSRVGLGLRSLCGTRFGRIRKQSP